MRLLTHRRQLTRERLNEALDSVASIGVVEGCRGSGKTTALQSWAQTTPGAVFIADAGAPDAWASITAALTMAATTVVVIDQFERAPSDLPERLLALPHDHPGIRVIAAGRTVGDLGDRLVRVRHGIARIGPEYLAFDDGEIETMLGLRPSARDRDLLRLPLVCLAAAALIEEEQLSVTEATRGAALAALAEALVGLEQLDRAIELLAIPVELKERIPSPGFSPADHRELLSTLVHRGLGVCHDGVFRFAPAWKASLNDRFRASSPVTFQRTHAQIAADYLDEGHAVEALHHFLAAGQIRGAATTAREYWFEIALLHPREALAALDRAGRPIIGDSATLCALAASCSEALGDRHRADGWWRSATVAMAKPPAAGRGRADVPTRAWDAFIRVRTLRALGMVEAAADAADEGLRILEPHRLLPSSRDTIATMVAGFAEALVHCGRLDEARQVLPVGAALAPAGSPGWYAASSLGVAVEAISGNRVEAQRRAEDIASVLRDPRLVASAVGVWESVGQAVLAADSGDGAGARRILDSVRESAQGDALPLLSAVELLVTHVCGDPSTRHGGLAFVVDHDHPSPLTSGLVAWLEAWSLSHHGTPGQAKAAAEALDDRLVSSAVLRAIALRRSRQPADVVALLAPLLSSVPPATTERASAVALTILAVTALELEETSLAGAALARLDALWRQRGTRVPGILLSESDRALLAGASPHGASVLDMVLLPAVPLAVDPVESADLSRAQQRVLQVLAEEASLASIARRLSLSRNTVKSHLRSIYRKLDAVGREDALVKAARAGLLTWNSVGAA